MLETIPPPPATERRLRNRRESNEPASAGSKTDALAPEPLPASLLAGVSQNGYLGPATVIVTNECDRLVLVQWERTGKPCLSWARPALAASIHLKPGDTALMLSQNLEDLYIIGLLAEGAGSQGVLPAPVQTRSGASVRVTRAAGEEVVQICSKQGVLVLEYHPESGKTLVNVENGDLDFVTHNGSISFQSAQKISLVAKRLETQAETVVAKASNVYETVEELTQLQTGRMRTLVKGSCHLKAHDAFLKAEQDFKVDGEQIHLG